MGLSSSVTERYFPFGIHDDWAERPSFRLRNPHHFSGRREIKDQLKEFMLRPRGGTALVSGPRGVGKTATVDTALIEAAEEIEDRNKRRLGNLFDYLRDLSRTRSERGRGTLQDLPTRPLELVVLKLDFSHIAPEPGVSVDDTASPNSRKRQPPTNGAIPTRQVEPRRVLSEIIRQLHRHFHSQPGSGTNASNHASLAMEVEEALKGSRMRLFMYLFYLKIARFMRPLSRPSLSRFIPVEAPQRRRRTQKNFNQRLSQALERAVFKTIHPEYRQKVSDTSSRVEEVERTVKTVSGINSGLFLSAAALMGSGVGLDLAFTQDLPQAWQSLDTWLKLGGAGSAGLGLTTTTLLRRQRSEVSRGVEAVYWEDSSSASLERDLEEILELLESQGAPMDYRFVVVVDELDKAGSHEVLDELIIRFKNFFTLSHASFVFITDESYYNHLLANQESAASKGSYSLHHTFFTQKLFMPRPDIQDIRGYLDSINSQVSRGDLHTTGLEDWDHVVNYLTFVSRSHFFDLIAYLNRVVGPTDDGEGLLLSFWPHQARKLRFHQMANFQRTVSIIYDQEKYPSAEYDNRNDQLMARLYRVFDSFDRDIQETFNHSDALPDLEEFPGEQGERLQRAVERLLELLVASEALEALPDPSRPEEYRWSRFLGREPSVTMLPLHPEQEAQLREVERLDQAVKDYQEVMA